MPAGLRIINDGLTLQLDANYKAFGLKLKGTVNLVLEAGHPQPIRRGSVTVVATSPILAIRSTNPTAIITVENSGNVWMYHFYARASADFSLTYYLFDTVGIPDPVNYGLQVFNADGSLAYNTGYKPLRIVAVSNQTPPPYYSEVEGSGSYSLVSLGGTAQPAGRTYATVLCSKCYSECLNNALGGTPSPGNKIMQYQMALSATSISGSTITYGSYVFETYNTERPNSTPISGTSEGDLLFLAVDVTNY